MTLPTAPRALAPWLLALCLTPLAAQQVFVVDVQGTTAWQQIQPAVQAASAGDVIRILPGVYLPFTCSKALRIEGSPGTIVAETTTASAMSISGIPAGSTCTIRGIDLRSSTTPCICEPLMMFDQCAGQVILDRVWPDYATSLEPKIQANAVASLLVNDSVVGPITAVACNLQLTRTQIRSASKDSGSIVQLTGSQFDMTDGTLNIRLSGTGEGIRLNNSTARLRVVNGLSIVRTFPFNSWDFFGDAQSTVVYHPATSFTAGVPDLGPFTSNQVNLVPTADLASLSVATAPPGGTVVVDMLYSPGTGFVVPYLASPGGPFAIPGITGLVHVGGAFLVPIGTFAMTSTVVSTSFAVPNVSALAGQPFVVQGVAVNSALAATNANAITLR